MFAIRDEPRADAKAGIGALHAAGVGTVMLTGDSQRTATAIGATLGMVVRTGLRPEDKQRIVRQLQVVEAKLDSRFVPSRLAFRTASSPFGQAKLISIEPSLRSSAPPWSLLSSIFVEPSHAKKTNKGP